MHSTVITIFYTPNIQLHLFPGTPFFVFVPCAVVEFVWCIVRAAEHVQVFQLVVFIIFLVHATHFQVGHLIEACEIIAESLLYTALGNIVLYKVGFQFFEKLAFVVSPFRFEPVFGIQEYFPVSFPHPVVLHPFPAVRVYGTR